MEQHQNVKLLGGEEKRYIKRQIIAGSELLDVTSCCCEGSVASSWCRWALTDVKCEDIGKKSKPKWSQTDFISLNYRLFVFQQVFLPRVGQRNETSVTMTPPDATWTRSAAQVRHIQRGFAPLSPVLTASDISEVPSTLSFDRTAQL